MYVMKNAKKITRHRLNDDIADDFIYIGLVSSEPDYKLSLLINSQFRITLRHADPVLLINGDQQVSYSRFSSTPSDNDIVYSLVSNKSEKQYLLRKLKNVDYIFCVNNPENEATAEKLATELRDTESVTAVFVIDPVDLKDKNLQYLTH